MPAKVPLAPEAPLAPEPAMTAPALRPRTRWAGIVWGLVLAAVAAYRRAMREFAGMDALGVWYARADVEGIQATADVSLGAKQRKTLQKTVAKAQTKDNLGALARFAATADPALYPPEATYIRDADAKPQTAARIARLGQ